MLTTTATIRKCSCSIAKQIIRACMNILATMDYTNRDNHVVKVILAKDPHLNELAWYIFKRYRYTMVLYKITILSVVSRKTVVKIKILTYRLEIFLWGKKN